MLVKQISVFVQNKPGRLSQITRLMAENGIDIRAISICLDDIHLLQAGAGSV